MSKILDLEYPKDFYSSTGSVQIQNDRINTWIQGCIKLLEDDKSLPLWSVSSGDSMVIVHRYERDGSKYKVIVTHGFAEKVI